MTYNIIKTENYILLVDDSPIKIGDYHTCTYPNYKIEPRFVSDTEVLNDTCGGCRKIIAHTPRNNAPILTNVDLIYIEKDDNT